jgi:hypothetical protein
MPPANLAILADLVDALANAGDVIKSLVDSIRHMVVTGVEGYDNIKARVTYNSLVETSALASQLLAYQKSLPENLDYYVYSVRHDLIKDQSERDRSCGSWLIAPGDPLDPSWYGLMKQMTNVLERVLAIIARIEKDRSDFVLKPAYQRLLTSLGSRKSLLEVLTGMDPPPASPEELDLVSKAANEYRGLIQGLEAARDELNRYLVSDRLR